MRKMLCTVVLLGLVTIGVPMTAAALGLDVEAKAGAGIGLGTTDNSDVTGDPRLAADGGIGIDLYLFTVGPVDLGLSTGVEYSYLTFHSKWSDNPMPGVDMITDATYNYVNVPIALVGSMPLNSSLRLVVKAGAFIGYFLSGSADISFDPKIAPDSTNDLDSDNTEQFEYGLHFTAGVDWDLGGGLSVAPALQFDMGLTDTTVNGDPAPLGPGKFNDTFWSLALMVGIKYKVL
jgi:hypothetical protein